MTTLEKIYAMKEALRLVTAALGDSWALEKIRREIEDQIVVLQNKVVGK